MAAVTICSDSGAQKNKVSHCFHIFPIYLQWSDGTGCHDLMICHKVVIITDLPGRGTISKNRLYIFNISHLYSFCREGLWKHMKFWLYHVLVIFQKILIFTEQLLRVRHYSRQQWYSHTQNWQKSCLCGTNPIRGGMLNKLNK